MAQGPGTEQPTLASAGDEVSYTVTKDGVTTEQKAKRIPNAGIPPTVDLDAAFGGATSGSPTVKPATPSTPAPKPLENKR